MTEKEFSDTLKKIQDLNNDINKMSFDPNAYVKGSMTYCLYKYLEKQNNDIRNKDTDFIVELLKSVEHGTQATDLMSSWDLTPNEVLRLAEEYSTSDTDFQDKIKEILKDTRCKKELEYIDLGKTSLVIDAYKKCVNGEIEAKDIRDYMASNVWLQLDDIDK